ncbi:MAG: tectonin domain-containing protein [bacterium]
MKKNLIVLLTLFTINICNAIDINIPIIDKKITPFEGFEPGEVLKFAGRLTDKTINAIKEKVTEATNKLQFWKEEVKKQEKSVPINVPYNYEELLSVDNQDFFTQIFGTAKQISVGKNKDKMSVWIIGTEGIPYEYNPSNKIHNLSWIKQIKNSGITKIAVAEDGTLAGIDSNGNIAIYKNNKWEPTKTTKNGIATKMTAEAAENFKAVDVDIANEKEIVYLNENGDIYKSDDGGMNWKSLPSLKNEEKFQNVSMGADGTIFACADNLAAYHFDEQKWIAFPNKIKKIAAGSKTNLVGISKDNQLLIFDASENKWMLQKNLISDAAKKGKTIEVIDIATNSSGNIWAITNKNEIITNIAANTNDALQKLKSGKVITINSLSENKFLRVENKERNYLKPTATDPEDPNTLFTIIRSGQYFGLQYKNQFVTCDPNEGLGEFKGSIKLSPNFSSGEKWLLSGELEQSTITSYANKKNLTFIDLETILKEIKKIQMEAIEKQHTEAQIAAAAGTSGLGTAAAGVTTAAGAGIGAVVAGVIMAVMGTVVPGAGNISGALIGLAIGGAIGGTFGGMLGFSMATSGFAANAVIATAIEFQHQRSAADVEDLASPVLNNPGLLGKIVMAYFLATEKSDQEFLPTLFDIEIQTKKQKEMLATDEKDFKQDYQFEVPGNGFIKFKLTGSPLNFWLWDEDKKEIILPGIIGGQNNTTISIGTPTGWQPIVKKYEIIKPNTPNSFWIEIKDNKLIIGSGDLIGSNKIGESETIEDLSKVKYVTFSKLPTSDVEISEVNFYSKLLSEEKPIEKIEITEKERAEQPKFISPAPKLISPAPTKKEETKPEKIIVTEEEEEAYGGI